MRRFLFPLLFLCYMQGYSQMINQPTIVPQPVEMVLREGTFTFNADTKIYAGIAERHEAKMLQQYVKALFQITPILAKSTNNKEEVSIELKLNPTFERKDGYQLEVGSNRILITSAGNEGLFYGIQTLLQLLPADKTTPLKIPQLTIKDYPRFQYRGMHLDVSRHFLGVEFVKKYIDYLAYQKFNKFHWHLTDDQGWRIEIKKYPKLTSVGGFRNGTIIGHHPGTGNDGLREGGYYTQVQIQEIIKYAKDRFIDIIPEIEMPGHASAAMLSTQL